MAELVLKPVADFLISLAKTEIGLAWGVKNEVRMLSSALTTIGAVVADAELKQLNNKPIQQWLIKLNHAAYDALDVFDDLAIDEPELLQPDPTAENCCNSVWTSCLSFFMLLKRLVPHYKIANKIKPVRERFDRIVNEMSKFGLIERVVAHVEGASIIPHQSISEDKVTHSGSAEPRMYGRDADKENIIKMLLQNVDNEHGLSVCPILGIGGLGKTTLAQFVFNDDRVKNHFDVQIWVCVSDHFNVKRLLKEIVEIVTKRRFDHDNLDVIRDGVVEQLRDKRFLLVLDDVWSDKQDDWNVLRNSLTYGAKGSSIIVTTRLKTVASITKTISEPYQLDGLSEDDCWSLFTFYAFEAGKESDNPNLVTIGKEIIKKRGRLPLTAKALGSMLRFKVEERQWREVRDSEIWELDEEEGSNRQLPKILPALRLSYNNLSARARQCFAYCRFFPKDYEMSKEELVHLWMANGLLEFKNKKPEDVGEDVFGELLLQSFFQDMEENEDGKIEKVKIHDLMHDLASVVMKSEYLHIEVKVGMSINSSIQDDEIRPRHVSIILLPSSSELSSVNVSSIYQFLSSHQRHLRTFSLISNEDRGMSYSHDVISVISGLKNLRALRVEGWKAVISLPLSFGDKLKHLRYLNLRRCGISWLHGESFRGIKNLQFLDLSQNENLKTIPDSMGEYMEHLKHLNLGGCGLSSLHAELFRGMKNLQILDLSQNENLKTLPDSMGEYMEHLKHLNLNRCGLSSIHAESFLGMKKLQSLDLSWNSEDMVTIPDSVGNLEQLRHLNLSKNEGLEVLPESLGNLTKLETLKLNVCWRLRTLPQSTSKLCNLRQLENEYCWGLRGMPSGIGEGVSRLEKLSMWVWGSEESENIKGLRGLSLLGGSLVIKIEGLRKEDDAALHDVEEVLTNKTNLSELVIWFSYNGGDDVSSISEQVLQILKPPSNIEWLNIQLYEGRRFPEWMEMRDPHSSSSFPRLKTIQLDHIKYVKEWVLNWRHKEECLPALQHLRIEYCNGLKGLPKELGNLATLKSLDVYFCKELVSVPQLICLEALSIKKCSELVWMPQLELMTSLKDLSISECPKLKFVFHGLRRLTSLQHLEINRSPGVVIPKEELDPLVALRGPSFLKYIDAELIHDQYLQQEDSTTT